MEAQPKDRLDDGTGVDLIWLGGFTEGGQFGVAKKVGLLVGTMNLGQVWQTRGDDVRQKDEDKAWQLSMWSGSNLHMDGTEFTGLGEITRRELLRSKGNQRNATYLISKIETPEVISEQDLSKENYM